MIQKLFSFLKIDNTRTLILNICTLIGGFGGMPDTPAFLTNAVKNFPFLKWLLLAVLIYQGGGEQDIQLAVELTVVCWGILRAINQFQPDWVQDETVALIADKKI
tara:strand:- start:271 stop:585 length:315 start_codon:yes stop_codon:yes gene_type:complete